MKPRHYTVWARCDCGDWAMCRRDGSGFACEQCDAYVDSITRIIEENIFIHRREELLAAGKLAHHDRSEYFRLYAQRNREQMRRHQLNYKARLMGRIPVTA